MAYLKQIFRNSHNYKGIIFVDRDGTLCDEVGYLNEKKHLKILPKVIDGIKILNKNGIAVIVVTNQPVVGHNLLTLKALAELNSHFVSMLALKDAYIDAVYSCPHHPEAPNQKYKVRCHCRKPNILLFKHAKKDFGIKKVIGIIGDTTRDIQFGKNAHIPTSLVKTGYKGGDGTCNAVPDFVSDNFLECVDNLLNL